MKKSLIITLSITLLIVAIFYILIRFSNNKISIPTNTSNNTNIISSIDYNPKQLQLSKNDIKYLDTNYKDHDYKYEVTLSCQGTDRAYNTGNSLIFSAECNIHRDPTPAAWRKFNKDCFGGCGGTFSIGPNSKKSIYIYDLKTKKLSRISDYYNNFIFDNGYYFFTGDSSTEETTMNNVFFIDTKGDKIMLFTGINKQGLPDGIKISALVDAVIKDKYIYYIKLITRQSNLEKNYQEEELHSFNTQTKEDILLWYRKYETGDEERIYSISKINENNIELISSSDNQAYDINNFKTYLYNRTDKQLTLLNEFKKLIKKDNYSVTNVRNILKNQFPISNEDKKIFYKISYDDWQFNWSLFDTTSISRNNHMIKLADNKAAEMFNELIKKSNKP